MEQARHKEDRSLPSSLASLPPGSIGAPRSHGQFVGSRRERRSHLTAGCATLCICYRSHGNAWGRRGVCALRVKFGVERRSLRAWRRAGLPPTQDAERGYAVVDAMVGLMIIATVLIEGLGAARNAGQASEMALDLRRAHQLMVHLMETAPDQLGDQSGMSEGFAWRVQTAITGGERPIEICRRSVELRREKTSRHYQMASLQSCPATPEP